MQKKHDGIGKRHAQSALARYNRFILETVGSHMILLKNISKTYTHQGKTIHALNGVDLHVKKGEIYGVVGQSGAGKSTLIRCVNLLERPSAGEVIVNGQNLLQLGQSALLQARSKIGMIFQHFNLLSNRTVFDNIALPLELIGESRASIEQKIQPLLELTGLSDKRNHYPAQLSGGQKQRVAIARALSSSPDILLSDEATSALDPKTTEDILNLLKNINEKLGVTILMITHEMEVVKQICHRVALIEGGKLVETAPVEQFFTAPQSALGKQFIAQIQNFELPAPYQTRLQTNGGYPIIKLRFHGNHVDEPLLSSLTKRFGVDISIIQAKIEYIGATSLGLLLAEIIGTPEQTAQAVAHLQTLPVDSEVIGYVSP